MINHVTTHSHYLPVEAILFIGQIYGLHPFLASIGLVAFFGLVVWLLRRRFERVDSDIIVTALFLVGITLFSASCLYLLITQPGFRVFHPGF